MTILSEILQAIQAHGEPNCATLSSSAWKEFEEQTLGWNPFAKQLPGGLFDVGNQAERVIVHAPLRFHADAKVIVGLPGVVTVQNREPIPINPRVGTVDIAPKFEKKPEAKPVKSGAFGKIAKHIRGK